MDAEVGDHMSVVVVKVQPDKIEIAADSITVRVVAEV